MGVGVNEIVVCGFDKAMFGCRLSMNSVDKMDSDFYRFGENDLKLAKKLFQNGTSHAAFMRQIQVWFRLRAPVFFWKHWDKYKWIHRLDNEIEERSESVMHGIMKQPLKQDDFCYELNPTILNILNSYIDRNEFHSLVNHLPQSYMQERMINTNLSVILEMVNQRKNHRLKEWSEFINQIRSIVYIDEFLDW